MRRRTKRRGWLGEDKRRDDQRRLQMITSSAAQSQPVSRLSSLRWSLLLSPHSVHPMYTHSPIFLSHSAERISLRSFLLRTLLPCAHPELSSATTVWRTSMIPKHSIPNELESHPELQFHLGNFYLTSARSPAPPRPPESTSESAFAPTSTVLSSKHPFRAAEQTARSSSPWVWDPQGLWDLSPHTVRKRPERATSVTVSANSLLLPSQTGYNSVSASGESCPTQQLAAIFPPATRQTAPPSAYAPARPAVSIRTHRPRRPSGSPRVALLVPVITPQ
ncbi:hypothetical protein BV20DRAFT_632440 [Pilatotrama ljubarskyi]|nr:hypothetical protein BV20DRAFT_632440 [Pilatotrama ljubarskyi]